jgi:hypothetical protein
MRRLSIRTMKCRSSSMKAKPVAVRFAAIGKHPRPSTDNDWSLSELAEPPVEVGSRALTPQSPDQHISQSRARTSGKAPSALPSSQVGAAAAEYGSRYELLRASATSTAGPWSSNRRERGAGSARRILGSSPPAGLPAARPNPSLKLTRYGRLCKPSPRYPVDLRGLGLQSPPPRAA